MIPGTFWPRALSIKPSSSTLRHLTHLDLAIFSTTNTSNPILPTHSQTNHGRLRIKSSRRSSPPIPKRPQRPSPTHIHNIHTNTRTTTTTTTTNKRPSTPSASPKLLRRPNRQTSTPRLLLPLRSHQPRRLRPRLRPLPPLSRPRPTQPHHLTLFRLRPGNAQHKLRHRARPAQEPRHRGAARARAPAG